MLRCSLRLKTVLHMCSWCPILLLTIYLTSAQQSACTMYTQITTCKYMLYALCIMYLTQSMLKELCWSFKIWKKYKGKQAKKSVNHRIRFRIRWDPVIKFSLYRIALNFRRSLISWILRIFTCSQIYFNKNFSHATHVFMLWLQERRWTTSQS